MIGVVVYSFIAHGMADSLSCVTAGSLFHHLLFSCLRPFLYRHQSPLFSHQSQHSSLRRHGAGPGGAQQCSRGGNFRLFCRCWLGVPRWCVSCRCGRRQEGELPSPRLCRCCWQWGQCCRCSASHCGRALVPEGQPLLHCRGAGEREAEGGSEGGKEEMQKGRGGRGGRVRRDEGERDEWRV